MATLASQYAFNNDYVDGPGTNDLSAQGIGNSFVTNPVKLGSHSLQLTGNGYANKTSQTGLNTGNADLSFGGWVQFDSAAGNAGVAGIGVSSVNANQNIWFFKTSATNIRVDLGSDTLNFTVPTIVIDTWYWVWLEYTSSTKSSLIYLNNNASSSGSQAHASNLALAATTNIIIGADIDGNVKLAGNLDDVRFYNGVTSSGERAIIYNGGNGTEGDSATTTSTSSSTSTTTTSTSTTTTSTSSSTSSTTTTSTSTTTTSTSTSTTSTSTSSSTTTSTSSSTSVTTTSTSTTMTTTTSTSTTFTVPYVFEVTEGKATDLKFAVGHGD